MRSSLVPASRSQTVILAVAVVVAVAVVADVLVWQGGCDDCGAGSLLLKVLGSTLLLGLGSFVFLLVSTKLLRGSLRPLVGRLAAVAAIGGGVLSAPVQMDWEEGGCAAHDATMMLVDVPRVAISKPSSDVGAYEHTVTLRDCG